MSDEYPNGNGRRFNLYVAEREIARLDRIIERHETTHVSPDAFGALRQEVRELKDGQRWVVRLLVTQLLVVMGGLLTMVIARAVG